MRAHFLSLVLGLSLLSVGGSERALAQIDDEIADPADLPDDPGAPDDPDVADTLEVDDADALDAPDIDATDEIGGDGLVSDDAATESSGSEPNGGEAGGDSGANSGGESSGSGSSGGEAGDDDRSNSGSNSSSNSGGDSSNSGSLNSGSLNPGSSNSSSSNSGASNSGSSNSGASNSGSSNSGSSNSGSSEAQAVIQQHLTGPIIVALDEAGHEHLAGEALMLGTSGELASAAANGYRIISELQLGGGDRFMARLLIPGAVNVSQAVHDLRALAPRAIVTINTAYRTTQASSSAPTAAPVARRSLQQIVLGIIDTGADPAVGAVNGFAATRGFGPSGYVPREHGSAVASIAASRGVRVRVADVFSSTISGEQVASASAIAAALQWMLDADIAVINISIAGPHNALLEHLVNEAARNGHVIVAAAGNGGPFAEPAFPGAYDGVVAVTAVDRAGHAYLRANRGAYIDFAALGVDVSVNTGVGAATVSGTSFAAPMVAALIAEQLPHASPSEAASIVNRLRRHAIDRGRSGRDSIYGWGEVRAD